MAKPVSGKSERSDWFLLGRDFPWKRSKTCIFVLEQSRQIQNLQPQQRNYQKKLQRLKFYWDFKDGWRRRTFAERVQYYREHLETFDSETETDITESQEAIDELINQQKRANANKETITDMNTLLRYIKANGMKNEKIESLPASELEHLLSKFVWTHGGKTEKNMSQRQFPVSSPV